MENESVNNRTGIVLNRMYVGDYLSNNIGHEVINLFQADNGGHYVYLNSRGNLAAEHNGKIGYMLFVKYYEKGEVEVLGKAVGLEEAAGVACSLSRKLGEEDIHLSGEQQTYIEEKEKGVFYNKASILKIFEGAGQQNIYITYKAKAVYRTQKDKKIIIHFGKDYEDKEGLIVLENYQQAKASLKQYIYPSANNEDYTKLLEIINNDEYWEKEVVRNVNDEIKNIGSKLNVYRENSLFDICRIQNDENRFSDALKYFMEQYPKLWKMFFKQYGIALGINYTVTREESTDFPDENKNQANKGRIDLVIRDGKNIIVIENKIKSDINSVKTDLPNTTQLNRYVNYVTWSVSKGQKDEGLSPKYFILAPDYNTFKGYNVDPYMVITYSDLYQFLEITEYVKSDANFKAFFEAMCRHTYKNVNDYLYYEMMEKFVRRINEVNGKK